MKCGNYSMFTTKVLKIQMLNQDPKWHLEDTDTDCVSSGNHGHCSDAGDTLGLGKAQGRAEALVP
jgi:hypothetical protein